MDETFCPMCGKANPADLDVCQFCEARLKPLIISPSQNEELPSQPEAPQRLPEVPSSPPSIPDWLRDLRGSETIEQEEDEQDAPPIHTEPLPDWFNERLGFTPADEDSSGDGDSDWLDRLRENSASYEETEGDNSTESEVLYDEGTLGLEQEEFSWLDIGRVAGTPELSQEPEVEKFEAKNLDGQSPESQNLEFERPEAEQFEAEQLESPLPDDEMQGKEEPEEEEPEWLRRIRARQITEVEDNQPAEPAKPTAIEEMPDWLVKEESGGGGDSESQMPGIVEETLPDWLKKLEFIPPEKSDSEHVPALIFDDEDALPFTLEQDEQRAPELAQLPNWVEAMRPVELVAPSSSLDPEEERAAERAGPLAGLQGVLPAETEVARVRKPPVYSVRLHVTESQQAHVSLLEELLASEKEANPLLVKPVVSYQYGLRLAIAILLLSLLAWTLWPGTYQGAGPAAQRILPEILDANRLVGGLPAGAPVLLAFDYEPGLTGEMDGIAAAVIGQIRRSEAFLTVISTNPTGAVQAERVIRSMRPVIEANQYTNLGYLAGGATGVAGFTRAPRKLMPFALDGLRVWDSASLKGVDSLADFSLVVVITDNGTAGRLWIEQIQPTLKDANRPLLLVTSAQAEPLIRPYYEGIPRQVDGMVAGLSGSAAFQSLVGNSLAVNQQWNVLGAGLTLVAVLIVAGGLFSGMSDMVGHLRWVGAKR